MDKVKKHVNWFRLDNAAKIFPSIMSKRTRTVFRISATLKESIDAEILQKSLLKIIPRFPYYNVSLRWGFFWHYLQHNLNDPIVKRETEPPCRMIVPRDNNGFLFRVLYYEKRISLECSHIITDGTGAVCFFKAILCQYFVESGYIIKDWQNTMQIDSKPNAEEFEDAYRRYYKKDIPLPIKKEKAFHVIDKSINKNDHRIVTGIIDTKEVLKKARDYGVTITELLVSISLHALNIYCQNLPWKIKKKKLKPIRLMVPVNLRKMYASKTMRNFFLTVNPGIDPRLGHYDFDDIIKEVYHYMRVEVDERYINKQISRNIRGEIHPAVRLVPLPLKVLVERMLYSFVATSRQSGVLTNMGSLEMPLSVAREIESFNCIANPNGDTKINCGVIGFNDKTYITFGSLVENTEVQKNFFRTIRKLGLNVKVETN
jgi:hypothetical protein